MYRYKEYALQMEVEDFQDKFDVAVEKVCSVCGRTHICSLETNNWHQIAVYHCDKGTDFRDTYKFYDVCSFECYLKQVKESALELQKSKTGRIDGMDLSFVEKLLFFYSSYFH